MTNKMSILLVWLVAGIAGSWAQDEKKSKTEDKDHKGSAELERIKSLAGEWRGNAAKERHIHSVVLTFVSSDKIELHYKIYVDGKAKDYRVRHWKGYKRVKKVEESTKMKEAK